MDFNAWAQALLDGNVHALTEGDMALVSAVVALAAIAAAYLAYQMSGPSLLPWQANGKIFLNKQRQTVKVLRRTQISHDVCRLRFELPADSPVLGLPVGKSVKVFGPNIAAGKESWNPRTDREGTVFPRDAGSGEGDVSRETGEWKDEIVRKYTPCTLDCHTGYFDIMFKVYKAGTNERFPDGGKMSQFMNTLKVGETLDFQGPFGHVQYLGRSEWKGKYGTRKHVGMICGGSGITPMLQVIQAILMDRSDNTKISLLYANQTEEDILCRSLLEGLVLEHKGRFKCWYTLDRPPQDWQFSAGFINDDMIRDHLPAPSNDTLVLLCGPPPMIKFACLPNLEKLGHDLKKSVASF